MSDFLLIVPPGWVEFDDINSLINDGAVPSDQVFFWIAQEDWTGFDAMLVNANHPVDGKLVTNAKLIATDAGFRCWMMFS